MRGNTPRLSEKFAMRQKLLENGLMDYLPKYQNLPNTRIGLR